MVIQEKLEKVSRTVSVASVTTSGYLLNAHEENHRQHNLKFEQSKVEELKNFPFMKIYKICKYSIFSKFFKLNSFLVSPLKQV